MLQCLEEEFQCQLEEQERHYGHYLTAALQAERLRAARYTPRGGGGGGRILDQCVAELVPFGQQNKLIHLLILKQNSVALKRKSTLILCAWFRLHPVYASFLNSFFRLWFQKLVTIRQTLGMHRILIWPDIRLF